MYPSMTQIKTFEFNEINYMICLTTENEFFIYKIFNNVLLKLEINFP